MQIVHVHYHLNRGGVTRVIENHLRALATLRADKRPSSVTIAYGGRAAAWNHDITKEVPFAVKLVSIPELDYDHELSVSSRLQEAVQELLAESEFSRDDTVLHVHNHSLGKKAALPRVLGSLAHEGWRLLLHIHDFAEDLRPANYQHMLRHVDSFDQLHQELYPQAPHIHYAVLNQRDYDVLAEAGILATQLHLLPNAVNVDQQPASQERVTDAKTKLEGIYGVPRDRTYVLYPVRGIRRKNLGEFLLWSLFAEDTTSLALTLAPLNPLERPSYDEWVAFAGALKLPVLFGVGDDYGLSLDENYAAADAIITTSVAEGFGLVYLEASLAGRYLAGRSLPGVTDDFRHAGMRFPGLNDVLRIPIDCVDVQRLKSMFLELSVKLRTSFGLPADGTGDLRKSIDDQFAGDTMDFGRLDSESQRMILDKVRGDEPLLRSVRELNPFVQDLGSVDAQDLQRCLDENRQVIERCYSLHVMGTKLSQLYESVLASRPERVEEQPSIARSVLDSFVRPSRLFPIRLES